MRRILSSNCDHLVREYEAGYCAFLSFVEFNLSEMGVFFIPLHHENTPI